MNIRFFLLLLPARSLARLLAYLAMTVFEVICMRVCTFLVCEFLKNFFTGGKFTQLAKKMCETVLFFFVR